MKQYKYLGSKATHIAKLSICCSLLVSGAAYSSDFTAFGNMMMELGKSKGFGGGYQEGLEQRRRNEMHDLQMQSRQYELDRMRREKVNPVINQLTQLNKLRESGAMSQTEYEKVKKRIIDSAYDFGIK